MFADFKNAVTLISECQDLCLDRWLHAAPAQFHAVCPSACEACVHPLANDASLELGKYAEHLKHCFASGRGCVEPLLMKKKANSLIMKGLEYTDQVRE